MSESGQPNTIEGSSRPKRAVELITIDIDGELLIVDPRTDRLSQLNPVGTILWPFLDGEATVDELIDDVAAAFDTPREVVGEDLGHLLEALCSLGLLEGVDPPERIWSDPAPRRARPEPGDDGLWRPDYLVDPPAP